MCHVVSNKTTHTSKTKPCEWTNIALWTEYTIKNMADIFNNLFYKGRIENIFTVVTCYKRSTVAISVALNYKYFQYSQCLCHSA